MRIRKNIVSAIAVLAISASTLMGCTTAKNAISETATDFLEIVASGSTENLEQYASPEVLNGEFVHTFDSTFLTDNLKSGIDSESLNEETTQRLDALCANLSSMITHYELTSVSVKRGVGTVIATVNTAFPLNIIGCEEASSRISVKVDSYKESNPDKINSSEPDVMKQTYNDMLNCVLETYEDMMAESEEESYVFVFTISKDRETKKWIITSIQDYASVANGKQITTTASPEEAVSTEDVEDIATTDTSEDTENTETSEDTEETEDSENTEETEDSEATEESEATE